MKRKSRVLIVDDAVETVELLKKRLKYEGYDTAGAHDGETALELVGQYNPDLIILDVMMPKMDGYEVCRRLKANPSTKYIPVLFLSARDDVEDKVKGLDVGSDDYLVKPFSYQELSARVRSLVALKADREKHVTEEKTQALMQVVEEVAHEIRNPLTSIGGFTRRVYKSLREDDPNKKYLEIVITDVARLEKMVAQLVELKTTAFSYPEDVDVTDILLQILSSFRPELKNQNIEIETSLTDLPSIVSADREQLKTALGNIIKNAMEGMTKQPKHLSVSSRVVDGQSEIRIVDNGKGIPRDKIKSVFDPFLSSKPSGPGLGLTFALRIIQRHRGTISVESEPNEGTTCTISLPLKRQRSEEIATLRTISDSDDVAQAANAKN